MALMNSNEMAEIVNAESVNLYGKTVRVKLRANGCWAYNARIFHVKQGKNVPFVEAVIENSYPPRHVVISGDQFDDLISPDVASLQILERTC